MLTDDGKFNLNFVNFFLARETTDRVDPGAIASGGVWPGDFFFCFERSAAPAWSSKILHYLEWFVGSK